jgi:hypothetical protein
MASIIGAALLFAVVVITAFAACGWPLGEFIMGGRSRVLPLKSRVTAMVAVIVQLFGISVILQAGGVIPLWFSGSVTRFMCFFFAAYLSVNVIMNAISTSRKERYVMTPVSLIVALCYWLTAIQM